jgi:cytochrome c-type biogenesis protein
VSGWLDAVAAAFQQAVLSGPLLGALPVALVAGLVSFASPCVLPLVPGYLGYIGGMTGVQADPGPRPAAPDRRRLVLGVALFVAGFSAVFVALSVAFAWLGVALLPWQDLVTRLLGVVVVLLGLSFLGFVPFLQRERRLHVSPRAGMWGAPLLGAAFGLGWAPCIGPTLGAVLSLSWGGADPVRGALLAVVYCIGLGLPFLLIALAVERSTTALDVLRRHRVAIMRLGGGLLVLLGLAMVTGVWGTWVARLQSVVDGFVTVV